MKKMSNHSHLKRVIKFCAKISIETETPRTVYELKMTIGTLTMSDCVASMFGNIFFRFTSD